MPALPKVATNFYYFCKKCEADRYHKVLAHVGADSARLQCEACQSVKNYKAEDSMAKKKATGTTKAKKPRKKKASASSEPQVNAAWTEMTEKVGAGSAQPYRMTNTYAVNAVIEHPKFGVGYVVISMPGKIDVAFQDSNRSLVQNRT
jgi:hypothetical protein